MAITLGVVGAQGFFRQGNRNDTAGPAAAPAKKAQSAGVTTEQLSRLQEQIALATSILNAHEAEAQASGLASGWRQAYLEMLMPLSLEGLLQVRLADSLSQLSTMAAETKATPQPAAIGSSTADLVYVPIAPCRYVDTRNVAGPITGTRGYDLNYNGSVYGGSAACNPTALFGVNENQFGALAMNVTIVVPTAPAGYAAVKPSTAAPATSAINWYEPGAILANQGIYTMDQSGSASEFVVETSSSTHVILDIFGAFMTPEATPLNHQILRTSQAVSASATFSIFSPTCPAGFRVTGGGHLSSSFGEPGTLAASRPAANGSLSVVTGLNAATQWLIQGTAGGANTMESYVVCAQLPGR